MGFVLAPRFLRVGIHALLAWCALVAGGLLLVSRGLYPGAANGDTWEHYLHYYREVLRSGSLGPNELWYHFYFSKGAGLQRRPAERGIRLDGERSGSLLEIGLAIIRTWFYSLASYRTH
jgi:hypothetical protein